MDGSMSVAFAVDRPTVPAAHFARSSSFKAWRRSCSTEVCTYDLADVTICHQAAWDECKVGRRSEQGLSLAMGMLYLLERDGVHSEVTVPCASAYGCPFPAHGGCAGWFCPCSPGLWCSLHS